MSVQAESEQYCAGCVTKGSVAGRCMQCQWDDTEQMEMQTHLPRHYVLLGRYYIGRVLGQGGFGVTYLARDLKLDRPVAVKEYLPMEQCTRLTNRITIRAYGGEKAEQFQYGMQGFLNEAKALAKLEGHANIVSVTDFAEANGTAYLVMSFIDGVSLKQQLANCGGRVPYQTAIDLLMPVMGALREMHSHGMLHRDISPGNIMITRQGQVKVVDFGAARYAIGEQSKSLSMILKPGYAPEEQYRTRGKQGTWTDVYATAATLYQCITGEVPPTAPDRLAEDELIRPSVLCPDLPPRIEDALLKGLAVRSADRYQTIEEFRSILTLESAALPPPQPAPPLHEPISAQNSRPAYFTSRKAKIILVACILLVLLSTVLFYFALQPSFENWRGNRLYNNGGSVPDAQSLWDRACTAGNADACTSLGNLYFFGAFRDRIIVAQDYEKATAFYAKACKLRGPQSCKQALEQTTLVLTANGNYKWQLDGVDRGRVHAGAAPLAVNINPGPHLIEATSSAGLNVFNQKVQAVLGRQIEVSIQVTVYPASAEKPPAQKPPAANPQATRPRLEPAPSLIPSPKETGSPQPELSQPKQPKVEPENLHADMRGVFVDPKTALMWTAEDNGENLTFQSALQYCASLRRGGYDDWRLPSIQELARLYDPSGRQPPQCNDLDGTPFRYPVRIISGIDLKCYSVWSSTNGRNVPMPNGSEPTFKAFNFYNGRTDDSYRNNKDQTRALCDRTP